MLNHEFRHPQQSRNLGHCATLAAPRVQLLKSAEHLFFSELCLTVPRAVPRGFTSEQQRCFCTRHVPPGTSKLDHANRRLVYSVESADVGYFLAGYEQLTDADDVRLDQF